MNLHATPLLRNAAMAFLAVFFFQCSEEETDNSARINNDISLFSNAAMQGRLTINRAVLNVGEIEITGTRPSMTIVSFSRTVPASDSEVELIGNNDRIIAIDAERNEYDPLSFTLTLQNDAYEPLIETSDAGETVNIGDYLQNSNPAFFLSARFDNRGKAIPVYVSFPEVMPLKSVAEQYGAAQVKIDLENLAEIQINPGFIFDGITSQQLESAVKSLHNNQEVIFIHPQFNSSLHTSLLARLEDSANSTKVKVKVTRSASDQ